MAASIVAASFLAMFAGAYLVVKADSNFGRKIFYGGVLVCIAILFLTGCSALEPRPQETPKVEEKSAEQIESEKKAEEEKQRRINEENEKRQKAEEERKRKQAELEASKVKNLGLTADQFRWSFNEVAANLGVSAFQIGELTVKTGDAQDVWQFNWTSTMIFQCATDKSNGLVKEVWILSAPPDVESVMTTVMTYGIITAMLNPEMTPQDRNALMETLKLTPDKMAQLNNGSASAIRGNVRYTANKLDRATFMLVASAKDL